MVIKNLNRSKNKEVFVCDHCGKEPEHLWEGYGIEGQYCFTHFRLAHEDLEEFDKQYNEQGMIPNE